MVTVKQYANYRRIRNINPHIPAWRVLEYVKIVWARIQY